MIDELNGYPVGLGTKPTGYPNRLVPSSPVRTGTGAYLEGSARGAPREYESLGFLLVLLPVF